MSSRPEFWPKSWPEMRPKGTAQAKAHHSTGPACYPSAGLGETHTRPAGLFSWLAWHHPTPSAGLFLLAAWPQAQHLLFLSFLHTWSTSRPTGLPLLLAAWCDPDVAYSSSLLLVRTRPRGRWLLLSLAHVGFFFPWPITLLPLFLFLFLA